MSPSLRDKIIAGSLLALAATAEAAVAQETRAASGAPELRPAAAHSIDLGPVAGVAYYTVERDGFHLVATLAPANDTVTPFRVEAVLAPGQRVTLSTPRGPGEEPTAVEISRTNELVLVAQRSALGN